MITSPTKRTVILTSAGGFSGLTPLKGLRQEPNVRIVIADSLLENVGQYFADRYVNVPPVSEHHAFIDAIAALCSEEQAALIIPCMAYELEALAAHRSEFERRGTKIAVSPAALMHILLDKQSLFMLLKENDIPTQKIVDLSAERIPFPVIGKPRHGWGGTGQVILHTADELETQRSKQLKEDFVWVPYLDSFVEYSADFAIDFSGSVSEIVARTRLRTSGGFAVVTESTDDPMVIEHAERCSSMLVDNQACGIFNLQIMKQGSQYFVSDLNPRLGTSSVFSNYVGVNLPRFLLFSSLGMSTQSGKKSPTKNVRMIRYLEEKSFQRISKNTLSGIVLDLDDTLLDHKKWIFERLRILSRQVELPQLGQKEFVLQGLRLLEEGHRADLFDAIASYAQLDSVTRDKLIDGYRKIVPTVSCLYAESKNVLCSLRNHGMKLGLLTDNPPDSQRKKLEACGLLDSFDSIIYSQDHGCEKPDASVFALVAKEMNCKPSTLAMVGDNLYRDALGALDSGFNRAYLIQRKGGFYNFNDSLYRELQPNFGGINEISSLHELLWAIQSN